MNLSWLVAAALAGAVFFIGVSWLIEAASAAPDEDMILSSDERLACEKVHRLRALSEEPDLPSLRRGEIWQGIAWLWKTTRLTVLQSGRWRALIWLAAYLPACLALAVKTLAVPNPQDLRILLGGNDWITFLVAPRGSSSNSSRP